MRRNFLRPHHIVGIGAILTFGIAVTTTTPASTQTNAQQQQNRPATVDLDELEDNPEKFVGKTVTVEGEVDRVLGPNLFTIDERDWADLEREMPVVVPEPFAAIVQSDAPVRVTGTVQKVPVAQIEARGGILTDPKIKAEIQTQPALVASEVSALAPGAVAVNLLVRPAGPVGTSGGGAAAPVTDAGQLTKSANKSLVGRRVDLSGVRIGATGNRGFWITTPDGERIFVMTADKSGAKEGQTAAIQGVILELPEGLRVELNAAGEPIYIYADRATTR
jgi:hypothetical protein